MQGDSIPSFGDICPEPLDLDQQKAAEHFFGRSFHDAVRMFEDAFELYQEDLLFMGVNGFCYYARAAFYALDACVERIEPCIVEMGLSVVEARLSEIRRCKFLVPELLRYFRKLEQTDLGFGVSSPSLLHDRIALLKERLEWT